MILDEATFHRALDYSLATFTRGEKDEKNMSGADDRRDRVWGTYLANMWLSGHQKGPDPILWCM
jgi:hypothetical protein